MNPTVITRQGVERIYEEARINAAVGHDETAQTLETLANNLLEVLTSGDPQKPEEIAEAYKILAPSTLQTPNQ